MMKIFATQWVSDCYLSVSCFAYLRAAPCLSVNNRFLYNVLSAIFMNNIFSWMCHVGYAACEIFKLKFIIGFVNIISVLVPCFNLSHFTAKSHTLAIIRGAMAKCDEQCINMLHFLVSSLYHTSATVILCVQPKWSTSLDRYCLAFYVVMERFAG